MNKDDLIRREIERHREAITSLESELSGTSCQEKTRPTVIALVLDESGSMASCGDATISGLNEYFDDRRKDCPTAPVFLTKFNSKARVVVEGTSAQYAPKFTHENYTPSGNTALYDAIGRTINSVDKYNDTHRILFVIMTDGQENASKEYKREDIQKLISQRDGKNWTFVYLAANQDAWALAQSLGSRSVGNAIRYSASAAGQERSLRTVSASSAAFFASCGGSTDNFSGGETDIRTED